MSAVAYKWRLTGRCWNQSYSIESPMILTQLTSEGSEEVTILINGTYSYITEPGGNWTYGHVTFTPTSITYGKGEYGDKSFNANCSER